MPYGIPRMAFQVSPYQGDFKKECVSLINESRELGEIRRNTQKYSSKNTRYYEKRLAQKIEIIEELNDLGKAHEKPVETSKMC